ncbi:class I SAM-dependent methyltransferase [Psychrosphaera sp. F3M07]|uniref:Class I SAM-dependent methyltransferase n=1 Tax=Psychrosphaera aquimarina TaxID=2044854 RepID=A0ABU3QX25_9GAMM|nr:MULTISPECIES: class I SAM-dependent methyltransferase [Psychrosphaera]MBU2918986.1 class I SAM-dependent methyltransferase [Psychrosphaera sp. F3M07]MDU0111975.1 class I SAM-dependent methyltransferase [Psychrosphaera aquimarina]
MKPALTYTWTESLSQWEQIPTGKELKHIQNDIIRRRLKLSFGHHLVKLGHLTNALDTKSCLIKHQINLAPSFVKPHLLGVFAEFDQLPFLSNSVDVVLMNHELEFASDPHQVLREIHRVLMPNGNLVMSVFNPFSLFIVNKLWPFKTQSPLWNARLFSIPRIKDWLVLLGFEIIEQEYCCYSTFLSKKDTENWLQKLIRKYLPKVGSVCIITAKKREWPLTPIRSKVRFNTTFQPVVSRASSNSSAKVKK